ncbi:HAD-IIB family hydrolase [Membranihabitans maritimus]|uniref:HAD-IIB family hydrolase n=1 Tax=Membranihabitans maritimus TaxID=2904244 RepID=UPI001EFFBB1A|nr:HAD-IIB family hydrolase [Membranihabitans maritimus]
MLRIHLYNIHGLIKSDGLEIGKDADNGGQIIYVYELARHLSQQPDVEFVHIFTRLIDDPDESPAYSQHIEKINDKCDIRRIPFAGNKYMRKERLWDHLDEYVENAKKYIKENDIRPNWIHSHYGDAGYVARELSIHFNIPFAHTGHSLGRPKRNKMKDLGMTAEEAEETFNFEKRIAAEESCLTLAEFVITSTYQEISHWEGYENFPKATFHVLPPGIDTDKFFPYYQYQLENEELQQQVAQRKYWVSQSIEKFLVNPSKPAILALARPDRKKNLHTLIDAYGSDKEMQSLANLVIFAGIRKDISNMKGAEKEVLTEMLLLMDKYDLYGKLAIPKKHDIENEVSLIYQYCAEKRGVFINLALHENFGLTTIEAAATGLPVVVTKNGGPSEIIPKCKNGYLVDPLDKYEVREAIKSVLTDEGKWRRFSNQGIIASKKYYSWDSHTNIYVGWIQETLAPKQPRKPKELKIPKAKAERFKNARNLLITDIDGTLIASEESFPGLDKLKKFIESQREDFCIAVASGRSIELIRKVMKKVDLDVDMIVSSVGARIHYDLNEEANDEDWMDYLDFKWNRDRILKKLSTIHWLELQEEDAQDIYKLSYYYNLADFDEDIIRSKLGKDFYQITMVNSHQKYIDILPVNASKGNAIRYLCQKWSIPLRNVIACGDSGNDMDMFRKPIKGIIVGNRSRELNYLKEDEYLYLAEGKAAEGIIEGLNHYGFKIDN